MKTIRRSLLLVLCLAAATARAEDIRWAGNVSPARLNALHAPDARFTPTGPPIAVSDFAPVMRYGSLAPLLRGSRCDLKRADVIAFEGNGGHGVGKENGFESSVWTFTDGTVTRTVSFNELVGRASDPSVICTGSIIGPSGTISSGGAAYAAFFRICPETIIGDTPLKNVVISFIVFDLHSTRPAIDVRSPNFSIQIANGTGGEGSPDPDAIGMFSTCSTR